jgi:hypothetical protein
MHVVINSRNLSSSTGAASNSTSSSSNNAAAAAVVGFSHMAGALMAMEHFNARNASVVPELANFSTSLCNVYFDMETSTVYDTGSFTHKAATSLVNKSSPAAFIPPCAIAGPYNDLPARDLSILALSYQIPQVAHRVFDPLFAHSYYKSLFAQRVF